MGLWRAAFTYLEQGVGGAESLLTESVKRGHRLARGGRAGVLIDSPCNRKARLAVMPATARPRVCSMDQVHSQHVTPHFRPTFASDLQ